MYSTISLHSLVRWRANLTAYKEDVFKCSFKQRLNYVQFELNVILMRRRKLEHYFLWSFPIHRTKDHH